MNQKLAILPPSSELTSLRFKGGIQTHTWDLAQACQTKGNEGDDSYGGSFFQKEKVEQSRWN